MRWFFLAFMVLVAVVGNLIGVIKFSLANIPFVVYFNVVLVALAWIWWHGYFAIESNRQRGIDQGTLVLLACLSIFLMKLSVDAFSANDCSGFKTERRRYSLVNMVAELVASLNLCRPMAAAGMAIGAWMGMFATRQLRKQWGR